MTVLPRRLLSATSTPFSSCKVKSGALSLTFMQIAPPSSELTGTGPARRPRLTRILHCRNLSRVLAAIVVLALGVALVATVAAQEERPQIFPGERKAQRKKDAGPRALGLVQLSSNGKASIIPLAILINGKFWDASAYKADPIPMALDSGNIYEGERSGSSLGLFTVGSALHSNNPSAAMPWLGTGVWRAHGTEPPTKAIKAESAPAGIGIDEAAPRLTRDPSAVKPTAPPANSAPSSSAGGSSSDSKPSSNSGDEPPRLNKPSSAPSSDGPPTLSRPSTPPASDQNKPVDSKSSEPKPSDSKPDDSKAAAKKPAQNIPASDSGASDANRPKLRRGKPVESFADEEIPGYSFPGVKPAKAADSGKVVETVAANKDVQLIPAISDAAGPIPHSYAFEWIPGEEQDRRKQMIDLAKDQVRAYVAAKSKNNVASTATHAAGAKRLVAPKPPEPELENMQMVAYDLWNSNQPVLILSAKAKMPPPAGAAAPESDPDYSIVLVAYPDIYHNLHKQFVAVTDKYHLDMTPRLELIDAVDADGDGVGDLLFRQTSDIGTGWVLYRVTADKLYKLFDSLNPV